MATTYESKIPDQLGLVAGMFDELGIGVSIDDLVPQDFSKRILSVGDAVKAMVLNGLGFVNQRLYLVSEFFETKPTERLIGKGITPSHINDDTLGRSLDALYERGVTEIYSVIGAQAAKRLGITSRFSHLDTSSFHVDGAYNSDEAPLEGEGVIHITKGYSRDHRPELNQAVLELMVENQAGIPILMKPLSGNRHDSVNFREVINEHVQQLHDAHAIPYLVADSSLYNQASLQDMQAAGVKWITRVPATVGEAKTVLAQANLDDMTPLAEGLAYQALRREYAGVTQRWLVIHSQTAKERAQRKARKDFKVASEKESKALMKLSREEFACADDALAALAALQETLRVCEVTHSEVVEVPHFDRPGRPAAGATPTRIGYRVSSSFAVPLKALQRRVETRSCFILATNELDEDALSDAEVHSGYKGQAFVEKGFRFLKDPMFLASSLFLKNPERIMALLFVMTLCLLVYAALQHRIRQGLTQEQQGFPDQKGKPTFTPTARWVFQCFVGIHLLVVSREQEVVLNLKEHHLTLLEVLGERYAGFYS
jgi:transposase